MKNSCQLDHVSKGYQVDGVECPVLADLTLSIPTDRITVILGKSGCGKTTLLRLLAGLEQPATGSITYYNKDGVATKPKIGVVFQEPRLMPWLDVTHNIIFHREDHPIALAQQLIELVGLGGFEKAYPHALSGGMASRVAIARALAFEPDLLLMDEPFAALDYFTRLSMEEEVIRLHQIQRQGIIFITHDVDEALTIGHRLLLMKKGQPPFSYPIEDNFPRDMSSPEVLQLKQAILARLKD